MSASVEWAAQGALAIFREEVLTAHQLRLVADYHARRWVGFACMYGFTDARAEEAKLGLGRALDELQRRSVDVDPWIPLLER
jgi:hypothetical protein